MSLSLSGLGKTRVLSFAGVADVTVVAGRALDFSDADNSGWIAVL